MTDTAHVALDAALLARMPLPQPDERGGRRRRSREAAAREGEQHEPEGERREKERPVEEQIGMVPRPDREGIDE